MVKVALVIRLVARTGKEDDLSAFLANAQSMAMDESFTPAWLALRTEPGVFYIIDAFANDADRSKHLAGELAKALVAHAPALLVEPPKVEKAEVLGVKLPG